MLWSSLSQSVLLYAACMFHLWTVTNRRPRQGRPPQESNHQDLRSLSPPLSVTYTAWDFADVTPGLQLVICSRALALIERMVSTVGRACMLYPGDWSPFKMTMKCRIMEAR